MKHITLYRKDFIKTAEADFFADVCIALGYGGTYEEVEAIDQLEIKVDSVTSS